MGRLKKYDTPAERTRAYRARLAELANPMPPTATPWADLPRSRRLQVLLLGVLAELEGWKDDLPTPDQAECWRNWKAGRMTCLPPTRPRRLRPPSLESLTP